MRIDLKCDILSDVLRSLHLRGAVFYQVSLPEDWAIEAPPMDEVASLLFPEAEHVMEYHIMAEGSGWAMLGGQPPVRLGAGDVLILPHGDAHVLSSNPELRPTRIDPSWIVATRDAPKPIPIVFHSQYEFTWGVPASGGRNRVTCGFLSCDRLPFNPLLASLPRLLHLPGPAMRRDAQMIQAAVQAAEQDAPGAAALLERASETMFIDAVLRYLDSLPERRGGWLAGLRDRQIGRALALIHQSPARPWSVDDLAQAAGLSRSVFCARFLQLTGQPPMQYLAQWRMEAAAGLLRDSRATVASVAQDVGYDSQAAFARAFKRAVGTSPARWRQQHAHAVR